MHYQYNYYHGQYYALESPPLGDGKTNISFNFIEDGGSTPGIPGGRGKLYINGKKVDEVLVPEMHLSTSSLSETFDVGVDNGTPVTPGYGEAAHFAFTGQLDKVIFKLTD